MSIPVVAHYRNSLGDAFCGAPFEDGDQPHECKAADKTFSLCITCAKAMWAFACVDPGEVMDLMTRVTCEGGPFGVGAARAQAALVALIEAEIPEGFMATVMAVRTPVQPPSFDGPADVAIFIKNEPLIQEYLKQIRMHGHPPEGSGSKIHAIKHARQVAQVGLREAKEAVEILEAGARVEFVNRLRK